MDYIDWFLKVLAQIVEASRASLQARQFGVCVDEVARALFGTDVVDQPGYSQGTTIILSTSRGTLEERGE